MVITLDPQLEAALNTQAQVNGKAPEEVALQALRERFLARPRPPIAHEVWVRQLRQAASDCGVSLSDEAVSSDGVYD